MFPLSTRQLAELFSAAALAGLPEGSPEDLPVTGCGIDSRQLQPGDVFFACRGQRQHGIEYAAAALAAGAVCVVTDQRRPTVPLPCSGERCWCPTQPPLCSRLPGGTAASPLRP